jgi:hypothetical protein
MKETIRNLQSKKKVLKKELEKIENAIDSLRDVCSHQSEDGKDVYEYEGHDSHYDYEKCSICGETRKV